MNTNTQNMSMNMKSDISPNPNLDNLPKSDALRNLSTDAKNAKSPLNSTTDNQNASSTNAVSIPSLTLNTALNKAARDSVADRPFAQYGNLSAKMLYHCEGRCDRDKPRFSSFYANVTCQCEEMCMLYDNCCEDVSESCGVTMETAKQLLGEDLLNADYECDEELSKFVVTSCPKGKQLDPAESHSLRSQMYVTDVQTQVVFRNLSVFHCHISTGTGRIWSFVANTPGIYDFDSIEQLERLLAPLDKQFIPPSFALSGYSCNVARPIRTFRFETIFSFTSDKGIQANRSNSRLLGWSRASCNETGQCSQVQCGFMSGGKLINGQCAVDEKVYVFLNPPLSQNENISFESLEATPQTLVNGAERNGVYSHRELFGFLQCAFLSDPRILRVKSPATDNHLDYNPEFFIKGKLTHGALFVITSLFSSKSLYLNQSAEENYGKNFLVDTILLEATAYYFATKGLVTGDDVMMYRHFANGETCSNISTENRTDDESDIKTRFNNAPSVNSSIKGFHDSTTDNYRDVKSGSRIFSDLNSSKISTNENSSKNSVSVTNSENSSTSNSSKNPQDVNSSKNYPDGQSNHNPLVSSAYPVPPQCDKEPLKPPCLAVCLFRTYLDYSNTIALHLDSIEACFFLKAPRQDFSECYAKVVGSGTRSGKKEMWIEMITSLFFTLACFVHY